METTLIILKPDAVQRNLMGRILTRFEDKGLQIVGCKLMRISQELAAEHYKDHASKPFLPRPCPLHDGQPCLNHGCAWNWRHHHLPLHDGRHIWQ